MIHHTDPDCIFCKIAAGQIPSKKIYEDDHVFAFHDINPTAAVHALVIPRFHVASLNELHQAGNDLAGHYLLSVARVAGLLGLADAGYRTVFNTGRHGGQTVFHLHAHIIGGQPLGWPAFPV